jgi:hypothetical protein
MFLPADVNHKQHGNNSRLITNRADRVPALLSRHSIDAVRYDQAELILEDESGQFERDSAMIPLVPQILRFVPFISHDVYTHRITNSS